MKKYKLKQLLEIKNGRDYKELGSGNIPVYGSGGIMTYVDNAIYHDESILLPRKGTLDNIMYVEEPFWTVDTMYWTIVNKTLAYPKYLYLYLSLLDLSARDSGSTLPSMTFGSYYDLDINLPNLDKQKAIANKIFSLNYKIENNNKIIKEFEQMSKTIYDYWFLQFDFPNEEGKPYKSSGGKMVWNEELKREIPEGWILKHAQDICDILTGKEDANHSTKNGDFPFFTCSNEILKCDDFKFDTNAVLIAGNGDFNVKQYKGKFNAYQRTYIVSPYDENNIGLLYLNSLMTIDRFKKGSNGSIVKFITLKDVQNIQILLPTNEKLLEVFNVNLEKIGQLKQENQELTSLRDFLLPLLMNGQAKVTE